MKALSDKEQDKLRELEIESILEETHYLADREKMEKTAQKYRVRPKMDDIFSNASKKPRLKSESPLDVDRQKEAYASNTIVGEKTAATMQAALIMDGSDGQVMTPDEAERKKAAQARKKAEEEQRVLEEARKKAAEEENKIVTLTPEYDDDTQFSSEVLNEVDQFREDGEIKSIDSIDIEINEAVEDARQESPDGEKESCEKLFGTQGSPDGQPPKRVVAKVPVYRPEGSSRTINVKAGKFSEVVSGEYEEYIRSKNPSVIAHVIRPEPKQEAVDEEEPKDTRSPQERVVSALVGFFSKDESDDRDTPKEKAKPVEDYLGEEDEKSIVYELNMNIKKLFMRSLLSGIVAAIAVILTVITRIFPESICSAVAFAPAAYAILNFVLVVFSVGLNRVAMLSGLSPLTRFKGNSDTAVAVAGVTAVIQAIVSFFCLGDLSAFSVNYYTAVVLLAFFANNAGKLLMVLRVKDNFRFASSKGQKYAAKIYNNETVANQMMSGTAADRPIIAYQHKTDFPSNFLKISYAPDPSEDLASKLAPVTTVAAVIIAVLYGVVRGSFTGALNALALITAAAVPASTLLAVNAPVRKLCKTLLSFGGMLAGYPSIKQFCDSTAIMIDANELFPADSIALEGIKTFDEFGTDESLLCGIAILKEAQNPIANVFKSVVAETKETLPEVESVLYEDEMGLVGWINSERILVGSRMLMEKYSVEIPAVEYEEKYTSNGRQVTYLSRAGRLVAMLVTKYSPDPELKAEMQRAELNGISFLIGTTDFNITNDLVAEQYNLFYRSIKVLPTGLGNVLREAESTREETSRSYLITGGRAASLARAVSGCVKIKHNISLAVIIQLIAVILGILLAATLALYAGVGVMGSLEVLLYALFWGAAAVLAPAVQKP